MRLYRAQGNALFLILIAVALFAALSYAVTQSGRGGGGIDREQASLDAAALINYGSRLQAAYQRLRLVNGCTAAQISFESAPYTDSSIYTGYPNANAPADKRCHFFHPDGGNVSPATAQQLKSSLPPQYSSVGLAGISGVQFVMTLGGISAAQCRAINTSLKYNAPGYEPNVPAYYNQIENYGGSHTGGGIDQIVAGQPAGCAGSVGSGTPGLGYFGSGTGVYWFYFVIGAL